MEPSRPTMFFAHGYGAGASIALIGAQRLAEAAGRGQPPFRLVLWAWPAKHHLFIGPRNNVLEKRQVADAQGFYLAQVIRELCPDTRLSLVGHSFGSQVMAAALERLARDRDNRTESKPESEPHRRKIQVALIASPLDNDALLPGHQYSSATGQADQTLITYNSSDRILRMLGRIVGHSQVLGLTGTTALGANEVEVQQVFVVDAQPFVGRGHRIAHYAWSPTLIDAIRPFLIGE